MKDKIRIVSDGTSINTHVTIAKTGEEIPGIRRVVWSCVGDGEAFVTLEIYTHLVEVEILGKLEEVIEDGEVSTEILEYNERKANDSKG